MTIKRIATCLCVPLALGVVYGILNPISGLGLILSGLFLSVWGVASWTFTFGAALLMAVLPMFGAAAMGYVVLMNTSAGRKPETRDWLCASVSAAATLMFVLSLNAGGAVCASLLSIFALGLQYNTKPRPGFGNVLLSAVAIGVSALMGQFINPRTENPHASAGG